MTPDSCISSHRSVPSRVRSPTPAKTETPPCCFATRLIISKMITVLPTSGTAEKADLAALHIRFQQVDDLDPGLEHLAARLEVLEWRRVAVDLPVVGHLTDVVGVERLADHVEDMAEHVVADGNGDAATGVAHDRAALETVGRLHTDAANATLTDLLGDFGR